MWRDFIEMCKSRVAGEANFVLVIGADAIPSRFLPCANCTTGFTQARQKFDGELPAAV